MTFKLSKINSLGYSQTQQTNYNQNNLSLAKFMIDYSDLFYTKFQFAEKVELIDNLQMYHTNDQYKSLNYINQYIKIQIIKNSKRMLGMANPVTKIIKLHPGLLNPKSPFYSELLETVIHELCHIYAFYHYGTVGHDAYWKHFMLMFNFEPTRQANLTGKPRLDSHELHTTLSELKEFWK